VEKVTEGLRHESGTGISTLAGGGKGKDLKALHRNLKRLLGRLPGSSEITARLRQAADECKLRDDLYSG
jgi:hypothetical protein